MCTFLTDNDIQNVAKRVLRRKLSAEEIDTVYSSIEGAVDFIDLAESAMACL